MRTEPETDFFIYFSHKLVFDSKHIADTVSQKISPNLLALKF